MKFMKFMFSAALGFLLCTGGLPGVAAPASSDLGLPLPPSVQALLGPSGLALNAADQKSVLREREVFARARLEGNRYRIQNVMLVHGGIVRTREAMTQFDRFAGMVPYIDRSDWNPVTQRLLVAGGIWKYRLQSLLQFSKKTPDLWTFEVVGGHFIGMKGAMQFETAAPGQTLVVFSGQVEGEHFPPRWVIERGAEIVFAVTGRRVRSLVEEFNPTDPKHDASATAQKIPQPRRRLESPN